MRQPNLQITGATLAAPNPRQLAEFYSKLLGWESEIETNWAQVRSADGQGGLRTLNFEIEPNYTPPIWPTVQGEQQIMTHLDIAVDDLDAAVAWATAAGARAADVQPQTSVRVMLDPAGHPFCLFTRG
ncbi:VOC family protein [Dactylosporangium roseum]|uniref:VOC family protein n=1 Tax=Dactylosporangium roseum TaxID=47989 RepID=A0ABY5YYN1_9ACTN|nr:VOC family protein [Dactylosporangium roseum]UWZ34501.1 VOC family protein [Dactylosporangium roseum]